MDRRTYLHQRNTAISILGMLQSFIEDNTADLGPADEMDIDEARTVSDYYEPLVDFMVTHAGHDRETFEPKFDGEAAEAAVEVEAEPAARPDAPENGEAEIDEEKSENPSEIATTVAHCIVREVEDLEIDEACLRLAVKYLVYAAMALRDMAPAEIESTDAAMLARITNDILEGAKDN